MELDCSDWCVVGVTPAATLQGRPHIDGAACAITANKVVALAEERMVREKHAGGSEFALRSVLNEVGRAAQDVTAYCMSTCGEAVTGVPGMRNLGVRLHASLDDLGVRSARVLWVPSHHLSHATAAASLLHDGTSGLILVADDAGSAREEDPLSFERSSAYVAEVRAGVLRLQCLSTLFSGEPGGLGSLYRHATELLGFNGYKECGKTTALAAYGRPGKSERALLNAAQPLLMGTHSVEALRDTLVSGGLEPLRRGWPWNRAHAAVAAAAQGALEWALQEWLDECLSRLDADGITCDRVVLSGGVALNCRAVGRLYESHIGDRLDVFHAPGDTGQALGNALWGACSLGLNPPLGATAYPFLGPNFSPSRVECAVGALAAGMNIREVSFETLLPTLVDDLSDGMLVALFDGPSEYGPRALGHRSILADPRHPRMREYLNSVKGREPFRPFGMAVLEDEANVLTGRHLRSPTMLAAVGLLSTAAAALPGGAHIDGTSRLQTVPAERKSLLGSLLRCWRERVGIPALLNTSFNEGGAPLVETPEEAIAAFRCMSLDRLVLCRSQHSAFLIQKTGNRSGVAHYKSRLPV